MFDGSFLRMSKYLLYFFYFPLQKSLCRITAIVVDESVRNVGVGKKLINFAATQAQTRSCAQLEVTTSLARNATQAYYESIGFKFIVKWTTWHGGQNSLNIIQSQ